MEPKVESFTDTTGTRHSFKISQGPKCLDKGYVVTATEMIDGMEGCQFSSWSPVLKEALENLRSKIKQGLAARYLADSPLRGFDMTRETLSGIVSCDGLVVDGKLVKWDDLITLLATYEGHQFDLSVAEGSNKFDLSVTDGTD
jgi:hypothetical protein